MSRSTRTLATHDTDRISGEFRPDIYGFMVERSELRDVRAELREDIARLQEQMRSVATKQDISDLRELIKEEVSQSEIKTLKQFIRTWTTGASIVIPCLTALVAAAIGALIG